MNSAPKPLLAGPPCSIRRATGADAPAIEALYRELVSDGDIQVLPEHLAALAESSTSFLLVAKIDDTVHGTALLTLCPDVMYGTQSFGVIENVVVAPAKRGRGLGRSLLLQIEQIATHHGCSKLMLLSNRTRRDAHVFFGKCGFNGETKRAFVKYRRQFVE
ncbi:GCN5-related N-acetyltransferase [Chthoniobacter flavus Ellin428]|uniref:GCN5-related N-acetyltransferase n=1 Tax=Chthoniobacter flavus Ellin428 TaxID=497964 RepID=B4D5V7_9BACT|nr:GNAT family N-acetyltransferase [Chthoniobacter flavus]EDY18160.1 GCN5-related N-acetyltransferase [Chthoniobacter flavus Ellin428]TCO91486.1 N-acetylglutamate synthase-like GNAT family acetyltransferase [Chthoniobacter flavus]